MYWNLGFYSESEILRKKLKNLNTCHKKRAERESVQKPSSRLIISIDVVGEKRRRRVGEIFGDYFNDVGDDDDDGSDDDKEDAHGRRVSAGR